MTSDQKRSIVAAISFALLMALLPVEWVEAAGQPIPPKTAPAVGDESARCLECHKQKTPAIVAQWMDSKHA